MVSELRLEALLPSYSCFVPFLAKRAKRPWWQVKTIPDVKKIAAKLFFGSIPCRKVPGVFFFIFCLYPKCCLCKDLIHSQNKRGQKYKYYQRVSVCVRPDPSNHLAGLNPRSEVPSVVALPATIPL